MDIEEARDLLREQLPADVWVGARKMDLTRERAVCIYRRKASRICAMGGDVGYSILPISVVVRGGIRADAAEAFADAVFGVAQGITEAPGFCQCPQDLPEAMGTDERGVYEYEFDLDIYTEK